MDDIHETTSAMTRALYYTLAVCIFGWIGITGYLVIAAALDPDRAPMPNRFESYDDYMKRVDSANKYRLRPFLNENDTTIQWKPELIEDEP